MADFRIEVGVEIYATDNLRYVGIQPPLDTAQTEMLDRVKLPDFVDKTDECLAEPYHGDSYTAISYETSGVDGNSDILKVASGIAETLSVDGHHVEVDEDLKIFGYGKYLFGGRGEI